MVELTLGGRRELAAIRQPDRLTAANGQGLNFIPDPQVETSVNGAVRPIIKGDPIDQSFQDLRGSHPPVEENGAHLN